MTKKEEFIRKSREREHSKVVLGLRMLDGTKEITINDNVQGKIDYICRNYDDNLKMYGVPIYIDEYLFIRK